MTLVPEASCIWIVFLSRYFGPLIVLPQSRAIGKNIASNLEYFQIPELNLSWKVQGNFLPLCNLDLKCCLCLDKKSQSMKRNT